MQEKERERERERDVFGKSATLIHTNSTIMLLHYQTQQELLWSLIHSVKTSDSPLTVPIIRYWVQYAEDYFCTTKNDFEECNREKIGSKRADTKDGTRECRKEHCATLCWNVEDAKYQVVRYSFSSFSLIFTRSQLEWNEEKQTGKDFPCSALGSTFDSLSFSS